MKLKLYRFTGWVGIAFTILSFLSRYTPFEVPGLVAFIPLFLWLCFLILCFNLWLLRGKSWGLKRLLTLSLLLLLCWPVYLNFQISRTESKSNNDFTVFSLNVGQFKNGTEPMDSLISFINKLDPDIVCLQEFGLKLNWQNKDSLIFEFARKCGMSSYNFARNEHNIYGIATLSKHKILNVDTLFMPITETNGAVRLELRVNKRNITIINYHLSSYNFGSKTNLSFFDKIERAERVKREQMNIILSNLKGVKGPLILAGDMNATPFTQVYKLLSEKLKDTFLEKGTGVGFTFPVGIIGIRIDYQLLTGPIDVKEHSVYTEKYSDHNSLMVRYGFKIPT